MSAREAEGPTITCRACGKRHGRRWMCDPVQKLVRAMMDAAEASDMPVTEFAEKQKIRPDAASLLGEGTRLLRQLVIKAGVVPWENEGQAIIIHPCLVITGTDAEGSEIPHYVFPGTSFELRKVRDVMDRMTEMAIRRAESEDTG